MLINNMYQQLLLEITDRDLGLGEGELFNTNYELRKSARAILLNDKGEMATQIISKHNFHKLPGGGVETGEDLMIALHREVKEEVGCDCEVIKDLGMVIEYRNKYKLLQISYGFVARVKGDINQPLLDDAEVAEGLINVWLPPEEALALMKKDVPEKYEGHFILKREIAYLEKYLASR